MRGYVVKSKNLPYYKCNSKGCCNNKNASDLHEILESAFAYFPSIKKLITRHLIACYNKVIREKENSKDTLKRQRVEIQKKIERLEERLILEEITLDLYQKYVPKFSSKCLN